MPSEVLFTRAVLAFLMLFLVSPHPLKLKNPKQEVAFMGAGLFGIVLYFMLENTALSITYASNVGIIVACAPFFVAVMVSIFFKSEKTGLTFYLGFVIAIAGVILISLNGQKSLNLNPLGDGLAFLAMISWGAYSALIKKIGEWDYPIIATTRRVYFLWNNFPDPGSDRTACILGFADDERIEDFSEFPVSRDLCQRTGIPALESVNQMDRSHQNQCLYLCIAGGDGGIVGSGAS